MLRETTLRGRCNCRALVDSLLLLMVSGLTFLNMVVRWLTADLIPRMVCGGNVQLTAMNMPLGKCTIGLPLPVTSLVLLRIFRWAEWIMNWSTFRDSGR